MTSVKHLNVQSNPSTLKSIAVLSQVQMGNLNFSLGRVQYDTQGQSTFPLEAQVGVGVGASIVALIVVIIVLIYRWVPTVTLLCQVYTISSVQSNAWYSILDVSFSVCPCASLSGGKANRQ